MYKKRKKHGYAERLKYMHMLENGCSIEYIHKELFTPKKPIITEDDNLPF